MSVSPSPARSSAHPSARIAFAFFLSGAVALIYQVCWQRLLFAVVGVDIESVTPIVSAFMLGLGLGAALGGIWPIALRQKSLRCSARLNWVSPRSAWSALH
jgi:xanthine/uracil permease